MAHKWTPAQARKFKRTMRQRKKMNGHGSGVREAIILLRKLRAELDGGAKRQSLASIYANLALYSLQGKL